MQIATLKTLYVTKSIEQFDRGKEVKYMAEFVPLVKAAPKSGTGMAVKPKTVEDRLTVLEDVVSTLMRANIGLRSNKCRTDSSAYARSTKNRDGIPVGISLIGLTDFGPRILTVLEDGYYIGDQRFGSLSAAAEAASGIVRKSGWVFWKMPDGRKVKDVFKTKGT